MNSWIQDVRHGMRSLSSSPGFVLLSVLCLGLGIGANTTVFSVVNGLLLQPLPFAEPNRLLALSEVRHASPLEAGRVSYPNFRDWQAQSAAIVDMAALRPRDLTISDREQAERHSGGLITWNFFPLLGIQPIIGRGFREDEDRAGAEPVVLLSEGLWRQRYAGDPALVGRSIVVDGRPHTVVGIMASWAHPALPSLLRGGRLWVPLAPLEHDRRRDQRLMAVYVRLASGIRSEAATAHLTAIARSLETEHPENKEWGISLRPVATSASATNRAMLLVMMGAVTFVLLIACANVANLMLARATRRRREIAIRVAIGASQARIVRQLLIESLLVGLMSAAVGVMLASWGVDLLLHASSEQAANISLSIDGRVLSFAIGISVLTSILFGLAPALHAVRGATRDALAETGRDSTASRSQKYLRNVLVAGEVALSLILLVVASLFVRSFLNLLRVDSDLDTSRLTTLRFEMPADRYRTPDAVIGRVEDVIACLEALPGIESVAASNLIPLRGGGQRTTVILEGADAQLGPAVTVLYGGITSRFFQTLNVPLLHGRLFTEIEARSRSAVAIVNSRMVERLWRSQNALGKRFRLDGDREGEWFTVIGVSQDISNWDHSHRPLPTAYVPYPHIGVLDPRLVIRTVGQTPFSEGPARQAILAADSKLLVFSGESMDDVRRAAFWRQELVGLLFSIFGAIAMLLAAVGVYGVLSYVVSQRTREIGVRLALGAERGGIVRLIVWQGVVLVLGGVGVGLAGALLATRMIQSQLFEVAATDPVSFGVVALLLGSVGLVASYLPAYRAAGVDPIASLRD